MPVLTKLLLSNMSSMTVLFYSTVIASATLVLVSGFSGRWEKVKMYSAKDLFELILIGILGEFLYSALYYESLKMLPAADASILNYIWPIIAVICSVLLLKEQISLRRIFAIIISFLGIIVIGSRGSLSISMKNGVNDGFILCLLSAACYGIFNVLNKKKGGDQLVNMTIYFLVTAVLSGSVCLVSSKILPISLHEAAGLLWMGVFVDALAFVCWAVAIQNNEVSAIVNFSYLTPIVAMILSAAILKEPIRLYSVIGFMIILIGIVLQEKTKP